MKNLKKIAIVVSKFNKEVTENLLFNAKETLLNAGFSDKNISVRWVPGAYELPFAANLLAKSKKFHAVICLGCIIKGETSHDVHIATWVSNGIGHASLATGVPILFGVLTPNNEEQALERSKPGPLNRGKEVAEAAIEMIQFKDQRI